MTTSRRTQLEYISDISKHYERLDDIVADVARLYARHFMTYADARDTIEFFVDTVFHTAVNKAEDEQTNS